MASENPSITLSCDELIAFLSLIAAPMMAGLDYQYLASLTDEEVQQHMSGGRQSLVDRELIIQEGEDHLVLDDVLLALVGGSVIPQATFILTTTECDAATERHYFNATPELLIEHHSPQPRVHVFDHLPAPDTLVERVEGLLAKLRPLPMGEVGVMQQIPASALIEVMKHCRQGDQKLGSQKLAELRMPEQMVGPLLEDCATGMNWSGLVAWDLDEEESDATDSVMAIKGHGRCWLVERVMDHPDDVRISPASGEECEKVFVSLLEPLKQALKPTD